VSPGSATPGESFRPGGALDGGSCATAADAGEGAGREETGATAGEGTETDGIATFTLIGTEGTVTAGTETAGTDLGGPGTGAPYSVATLAAGTTGTFGTT